MGKIFIAIDVGCHECGVGSELIGVYKTLKAAEKAIIKRTEETSGWRDGGQSIPEVFEAVL